LKIWGGFKKLFRIKNDIAVTNDKAWSSTLWNLYGTQNDSGEIINEETALKYSAVFNAITLIASTIASLPLNLMQRRDRATLPLPGNPLFDVLHSKANEYMTAMAFRETILAHVLTHGNGYAEIVRNGYGQVVELWPIPPNRVSPKLFEGELVYEINVGGEIIVLRRDKILHIAGLGYDGFVGYSVIQMAAQAIGLGKAMETFGAKFFGSGTNPGLVIKHPGRLTEAAHKRLKESIEAAQSGLSKSHRLMLLEEGMTADKSIYPPTDSQFIEGRSFQITDVARWFNVPVHKLKEMSKSSFNNIESEQISFVVDCLRLWCVRLEQAYDTQLLTTNERRQGIYFTHILEGLLRGSSKDRAEFYGKLFFIGAMTINEIREKENLNPVEGGDTHFVPVNMVTLENSKNLGALPPAAPQPNKQDQPMDLSTIGITIPVNTHAWNLIPKDMNTNEK
jgi:HK97 family phage portal protein